MTTPVFQPGKFQPVISIVPFASSEAEAVDSDFSGLNQVAFRTLFLSASRAYSHGGGSNVDRANLGGEAETIAHFLAARNCAEQLSATQAFHTRVTTPLVNATIKTFEPITRTYNMYGHFEVDGKTHATRDLRNQLAKSLVKLASVATDRRILSGAPSDDGDPCSDIDFRQVTISDSGELVACSAPTLRDRQARLARSLLSEQNLKRSTCALTLAQDALRCTTELQYHEIIRVAESIELIIDKREIESALDVVDANTKHNEALRRLFSLPKTPTGDDPVIQAKYVITVVNRAVLIINRITSELDLRIKTGYLPKYEGGSRAQVAHYTDGLIWSEYSLTPGEITIATAVKMCDAGRRRYKCAPFEQSVVLLDELISQSFV